LSWVDVVVAAVDAMVAVDVPLDDVDVNDTVVGESEQVGRSTALVGEVVSAQDRVAVPT
jgi:hypothetical protein